MAKVDISKLIKRAEEALNRRNYDLAVFNYIQALSIQPENIDARTKLRATQTRAANESGGGSSIKMLPSYVKAVLLTSLGKQEQAIIAAENALTSQPASTAAMKTLASAAAKAELTELAAWQRQEIASKHDQEDAGNLWELVELYKALERPTDALHCLDKIREMNPDDPDVERESKDISAMETSSTYARGVERGSHEIVKDEEERDFLELDSNKLRTDDARLRYVKYRQEHDAKERPDDHRVYLDIANVYFDLEDWETGYAEAKKNLEKAHELNPSDNTVMDRMGDLEIKNMHNEFKTLQHQVKSNPKAKGLKQKLKKQREELLDYEIAEYERRVKAQPLKANFHNRLGELYFQAERYDDAVGELQQAAKDPKFKITALTSLGRSFYGQEQYDLAIEQYRRAREKQELYEKIREPMYYEAQAQEAKEDAESLKQALELYTYIYQLEINYKDVKKKVPELQRRIREMGETAAPGKGT